MCGFGADEVAHVEKRLFEQRQPLGGKATDRFLHEFPLQGDAVERRLAACLRQKDRVRAAVAANGAALDEAGGLQPVDEAGNIAFGDVKPLRQLLLAQAFLFGQRRQHVALRHGQADAFQPAADLQSNARLKAKKSKPDSFGVGGVGHGFHLSSKAWLDARA